MNEHMSSAPHSYMSCAQGPTFSGLDIFLKLLFHLLLGLSHCLPF